MHAYSELLRKKSRYSTYNEYLIYNILKENKDLSDLMNSQIRGLFDSNKFYPISFSEADLNTVWKYLRNSIEYDLEHKSKVADRSLIPNKYLVSDSNKDWVDEYKIVETIREHMAVTERGEFVGLFRILSKKFFKKSHDMFHRIVKTCPDTVPHTNLDEPEIFPDNETFCESCSAIPDKNNTRPSAE